MSEPAFVQTNDRYSMTCSVRMAIFAPQEVIWWVLTDAQGFSQWNSTVERIDGDIREGERLGLHVPGVGRVFTPRVSQMQAPRSMVWSDGLSFVFRGVRRFELRPLDDGAVEFCMEERFSGLVFALVRKTMPDFRPIFETYARDLCRESERVNERIASRVA